MTAFPSYAFGTVSVDAGGTVVTGTDTLWSGVNARAGDDITIAGHTVIIVDVTDETHLVIDAWPYDAVTAGTYKITQRSPLRFVGAEARADVTRLLSTLEAKGLVWTLDAAYASPNDLKPIPTANEGQLFYQPSTGKFWAMTSGAWTSIASPYGLQAANALSEIAALGPAKQSDAQTNLGVREVLTAARQYFVRTDGNDSNNGLANTSAGAFLTIQHALNVVASAIDANGHVVTISVGDGARTEALTIPSILNSGNFGMLYLLGNITTPANCSLSVTSNNAIYVTPGAKFSVGGFKLSTTTSGDCLNIGNGATVSIIDPMDFGACAGFHIVTNVGASCIAFADYTISGGAVGHIHVPAPGSFSTGTITVTLTGTPAFGAYFTGVSSNGACDFRAATFVGAATGTRFVAHQGGEILPPPIGGLNALPGDIAGWDGSGGRYYIDESSVLHTVNFLADMTWVGTGYTPYTPTASPTTGSLSGITITNACYKKHGKTVFFHLDITCGTFTGASGRLKITLPSSCLDANGRANGVNTDGVQSLNGFIYDTQSAISVQTSANGFPAASGDRIILRGDYEEA